MTNKTFRLATIWTFSLIGAFVAWVFAPSSAKQSLAECFYPSTVRMMPLSEGCVHTDEAPPSNIMQIVDHQRKFYNLEFQKIVTCRAASRLPESEPALGMVAFRLEVLKRWLPLYVGCCSYQFRRHVAVVVAEGDEKGSLVVEAVLIQSRRDYLRLNWNKDRSCWY